jgi:hypothetical protein
MADQVGAAYPLMRRAIALILYLTLSLRVFSLREPREKVKTLRGLPPLCRNRDGGSARQNRGQ